jgi:hypothetical protein
VQAERHADRHGAVLSESWDMEPPRRDGVRGDYDEALMPGYQLLIESYNKTQSVPREGRDTFVCR